MATDWIARLYNRAMSDNNYPMHIVAAGGLVTNSEGKVLMIKSPRYGDWEFPGGQAQESETIPLKKIVI